MSGDDKKITRNNPVVRVESQNGRMIVERRDIFREGARPDDGSFRGSVNSNRGISDSMITMQSQRPGKDPGKDGKKNG